MYISIQTVCGCHGFLLFESIHCDRCRSLIPFQLSDESLIDPVVANNLINGINTKSIQGKKQVANALVSYRKHHHHDPQHSVTTGRVRFRALCPFCNCPNYVLRYYCKRERIYYHLRIQNFSENEQSVYKSISDTQNMNHIELQTSKHTSIDSSGIESVDSISLSGSTSQQAPSTILYDQGNAPTAQDIQIENEKKLYALNSLEGDLFNVLRNGLFYDTIIQCQDEVKLQVHRCILGGRSPWFRHLLGEYHDSNTQEEYVLQISIDDVQSDVMNEILNFLYTNRCLISLKNAPDLLIAAKRFELEKLRKQIADFLLSRLNVENAIDMLISAHEAGSEALKLACIRIINRNAEKIKRTEKWKTFKTQYIDLVPELYENRIERPHHGAAAYLPDVFSAPTMPSDSLVTLSQLYENPTKKRATSPSPRILPPPTKSKTHQQIETVTQGTSGPFVRDNRPVISPINAPEHSVKKGTTNTNTNNNTRRRPAPPAAPPLTRTVFPTIRQPAEDDAYRRPVNIYDKSAASTTNNQKQHTINNQTSQKQPPPATTKVSRSVSTKQVTERQRTPPPTKVSRAVSPRHVIARQRSPPPTKVSRAVSPKFVIEYHESPTPVKISRAVSPRHIIELQRSPTLTDTPQDERLTIRRIVSAETTD